MVTLSLAALQQLRPAKRQDGIAIACATGGAALVAGWLRLVALDLADATRQAAPRPDEAASGTRRCGGGVLHPALFVCVMAFLAQANLAGAHLFSFAEALV